jgi:hypothetical protein
VFVLTFPLATIGAVPFAERMVVAFLFAKLVTWVSLTRMCMIFNALILWFPVAVGIPSVATFAMGNAA